MKPGNLPGTHKKTEGWTKTMKSNRKCHSQNTVLERITNGADGNASPQYKVVVDRIETFDLAERTARKLAADQPGSVFVVAKTWPAIAATVTRTVKFVNPELGQPPVPSNERARPVKAMPVLPTTGTGTAPQDPTDEPKALF
jgi:hypothetical protein